MRQDRSLRFECLEDRSLLSTVHYSAAHHAAATVPVVLSGTLSVNNHATTSAMNGDGSSTVTAPLKGQVGGMGQVRGIWEETTDSFGGFSGPDMIRLHNAKGTVVLTFDNQNSASPHRDANGAFYYEHTQRALGGTGAFAHAAESGTIQLLMRTPKANVNSIVLNSQGG